jgi:hypothetical protein
MLFSNQRKLSITLLLVVLALTVIWDIALYFLPQHDTVWNYLFNICYATFFLYALFVGIYGAKHLGLQSAMGKALLFLGLGSGAYGLATYIWVFYNIVLHVEVPFPSIADVFFLLLAPLMAIGCWHLISTLRSQVTSNHVLESVGILIIACVIIFGFVYKVEIAQNVPFLTNVINVLYPLGDVALICLAFIVWRTGGGKIHHGVRVLVVVMLLQTIADSIFTVQTSTDTYWNGGIADAMWALAGFVFSLAVIKLYNDFVIQPDHTLKTPAPQAPLA